MVAVSSNNNNNKRKVREILLSPMAVRWIYYYYYYVVLLALLAGWLAISHVPSLLQVLQIYSSEHDVSSEGRSLRHQRRIKAPITVTYQAPPRIFYESSPFTLDEFIVNGGANLAQYGFEHLHNNNNKISVTLEEPYLLYQDFDISHPIEERSKVSSREGASEEKDSEQDSSRGGVLSWSTLIHHKAELHHPTLSFYADKIASKRWMKAMGIPIPHCFALRYQPELVTSETSTAISGHGSSLSSSHASTQLQEAEQEAFQALLPKQSSFVAKPSNRGCSSGVWVVHYDADQDVHTMGYMGKAMTAHNYYSQETIVHRIVHDLHRTDKDCGDWAMDQLVPGLLIEERFAGMDEDDNTRAAMEFKVFTIWGRVWMANWRRGVYSYGLVHRNGTMMVDYGGDEETKESVPFLPEYVDWSRVVELAERLGRHKDMYRVDVFVGVPAHLAPSLRNASLEEKRTAAQYRVSETEFYPTMYSNDPRIFAEGARLWMAGYKMGIYKRIPNTEVPKVYLEHGMLTEEQADAMSLPKGEFWTNAEWGTHEGISL